MRKIPCVSIIFNTTQDISKIDKLITMFRYVQIKTDEEDRLIKLEMEETCGVFIEVYRQKSEHLENVVVSRIEDFPEV